MLIQVSFAATVSC